MTYRSEIDAAIDEFEESVKTCVHLVYASEFYEESTRHWSKERERKRERLRKLFERAAAEAATLRAEIERRGRLLASSTRIER
jgi:hypothetical protein